MRPLKRDPAPSMLRYRLGRLWLTPGFQRAIRIGPIVLALILGTAYLVTNQGARTALTESYASLRDSIVNREEFRVSKVQVRGASLDLQSAVVTIAADRLPSSSLDLDVAQLRDKVETLPAVAKASVRIGPGGVLQIDVTERIPVLVWRYAGAIHVLDQNGAKLGTLDHRADRPDLPLVLGHGADAHVQEALDLLIAAGPVADRVRGLQRMANRRWNLILDRDQTILLPVDKPRAALRRVMGLHQADDILNRDISVVDMRNGNRPVLRLGDVARSELTRLRAMENGDFQ